MAWTSLRGSDVEEWVQEVVGCAGYETACERPSTFVVKSMWNFVRYTSRD